ncbi:hypothetical protein HOM13_02625 [Candidatus Woesearchaeota archaeon]|nr:hypothetical protein [Candidatus Woesearchaeota archaeon]
MAGTKKRNGFDGAHLLLVAVIIGASFILSGSSIGNNVDSFTGNVVSGGPAPKDMDVGNVYYHDVRHTDKKGKVTFKDDTGKPPAGTKGSWSTSCSTKLSDGTVVEASGSSGSGFGGEQKDADEDCLKNLKAKIKAMSSTIRLNA